MQLQSGGGSGGLGGEALLVGRMLRRDFEKFGVHLPPRGQARLAGLTDGALQLGMRFGACFALNTHPSLTWSNMKYH